MSDQSLILCSGPQLAVSVSDRALQLIDEALDASAPVGLVNSPETNRDAVEAQRRLKEVYSAIESARKAAKEPFLEAGRRIDAEAKKLTERIQPELSRVNGLISDYQTKLFDLEQARIKAEAEERRRIERERREAERKACEEALRQAEEARRKAWGEQEAIRKREEAERATAKTEEEKRLSAERAEKERQEAAARAKEAEEAAMVKLQEETKRQAELAQQQLEAAQQSKTEVRASGQRITVDYDITVHNILDLVRAHPGCVEMKPRLSEIKLLIKSGMERISGVTWKQIAKSSTTGKGKVIDI